MPRHLPPIFLLTASFLLAACAEDADPVRIDKPAVAGLLDGEISSAGQYLDQVEETNRRNADKARRGDWTYARPAVGEPN